MLYQTHTVTDTVTDKQTTVTLAPRVNNNYPVSTKHYYVNDTNPNPNWIFKELVKGNQPL